MSAYQIRITRQAKKDIVRLTPKLRKKLHTILVEIIAQTPYEGKKLQGDLDGYYSIRLSYQDRIVYSVDEKNCVVYIRRARTHYGE